MKADKNKRDKESKKTSKSGKVQNIKLEKRHPAK